MIDGAFSRDAAERFMHFEPALMATLAAGRGKPGVDQDQLRDAISILSTLRAEATSCLRQIGGAA
ncbi:hypothetical protein [Paracoccus sp. SY]|uniref:hypothetical protein n=1 Tax=Paracoccus sp. SY TaxID=1330255 RepID=UPI000CD2C0FC|nr:hypothetical protein [Paracoccus sp. SY]